MQEPANDTQLRRLLEEARKRLIETGTRNRLIHTNRRSKRPSTLAVSYTSVDALFKRLCNDAAQLRFRADPRIKAKPDATDDPDGDPQSAFDSPASSEEWLQTRVAEETLQKKLLKFYREGKTLEEEQGVNILYLAIGFLRWYEDENSEIFREAPLLLLPISLIRDLRRSTFDLRLRDDDLNTNLSLSERLRDDFGIVLPSLPDSEDWRPSDYFDRIEQAVAGKRRWTIDRAGIELGFFSFAKLLMFIDLDPQGAAGRPLLGHPLLRGLMVEGFAEERPLFPDDARLDEMFAPEDLIHVVDADGSQALAIETVRAGRNLVIKGPPGTGKSQTIANLVAGAVNDGKTVLFVAEKMVALEVVHRRLVKAGLGPVCLQLHSRSANKRALAEELGRTLSAGTETPAASTNLEKLRAVRDRLTAISNELHGAIGITGMTPYRVLGELIRSTGRRQPPPQIRLPQATDWTAHQYQELQQSLERFAQQVQRVGNKAKHPWSGVGNVNLQPTDLVRTCQVAGKIGDRILVLLDLCNGVLRELGLPAIHDLAGLDKSVVLLGLVGEFPDGHAALARKLSVLAGPDLALIQQMAAACVMARRETAALETDFHASAFVLDTITLRRDISHANTSVWARFSGPYKRSSAALATVLKGPIPRKANERVALLDRLASTQESRKIFGELAARAAAPLGDAWTGEASDFGAIEHTAMWLRKAAPAGLLERIEQTLAVATGAESVPSRAQRIQADANALRSDLGELCQQLEWQLSGETGSPDPADLSTMALPPLADRLRAMSSAEGRYPEWAELHLLETDVRKAGGATLIELIANGQLPAARAVEELRYARAEALWKDVAARVPSLGRSVYQGTRSGLVRDFIRLEHERRSMVPGLVRSLHAERMPRGAVGEMATIRGEIARKRGHMAIRKLIGSAGRTVQKIKPVFMMSPISVAQFLPLGAVEFDLVVIDEASQVRPEDALGLIARGRQIVVVGDREQLPPTAFFARLLADDEDADDEGDDGAPIPVQSAKATDMESILTLCLARGVPAKMLRWHYRSRHPSLIEVSNVEFYQSNLFMPPSPAAQESPEGLHITRVVGGYDRGGKRTNSLEAQAVVEAVARHAQDKPELSLGIVTFSTAQRDLIANLLDERRRTEPAVEIFLNRPEEEAFVKNLENVQGDERDVILISVGYGPRIAGARLDSMNFGPVSAEGGERRLNVLFTRARHKCEVFVSFDSDNIDLARAAGQGPRVLKRFLAFAETGVLEQPSLTGADYDSPFEEEVAGVIRSAGYEVDPQVGTAGFRVDLGVKDPEAPGRYILAVECDGATYHGALWARQRDRLRQEILESLGWRFHRIWSTDWFYRRDEEIARLGAELARAKAPAIRNSADNSPFAASPPEPPPVAAAAVAPIASPVPMYRLWKIDISRRGEPHEVAVSQMAILVGRIVECEGPIHQAEVARRVATSFGKERTGARIMTATLAGLRHDRGNGTPLQQSGEFWFTPEQAEGCPIRDRSLAPLSLQRADMLPPLEIRAAVRRVIRDNGAIPMDEAPAAVARLFGYQRTGPDIRDKIRSLLRDMAADQSLALADGVLRLPS